MNTLLIRANVDSEIGTGHLMRCLALAQAWKAESGRVTFAVNAGAEALAARLRAEGVEIVRFPAEAGSEEDGRAVIELAHQLDAAWVVVDGYCFGSNYQKMIKESNLQLLFVDDDAHTGHYFADAVLNPNLHACQEMYAQREPYTQLLLGPRYSLLRSEFRAWGKWKRHIPKRGTKLLVTLGGADRRNVTFKVLQALEQLQIPDLEAKVVIGPIHPKRPLLQATVEKSDKKTEILTDQVDMPALMAWADVAIAGAGSTSWELCFMGVPSLLIIIADNQRSVAAELDARRAAINLGADQMLSPEYICEQLRRLLWDQHRRRQLMKQGHELINGEGAARVVVHLRANSMKLRRAQSEDCKLLWEWANDPQVRASSFSTTEISWEQHIAWFKEKLNDRNCFLFLGCDAYDNPIGQIRFDVNEQGEAIVSISVAPQHRKLGYGRLLISRGVEALASSANVSRVHAHVRLENNGSRCAFQRAGFRKAGNTYLSGSPAVHYLKELC